MTMTMAHNVKLSLEQIIRAILDGEMPDGTNVLDDVHLGALAEALDALDPKEIDGIMNATGGGVALAKTTAEKLYSQGTPTAAKNVSVDDRNSKFSGDLAV